MNRFLEFLLAVGLTSCVLAGPPHAGDIGTIASSEPAGALMFLPWGNPPRETVKITVAAKPTITIAASPGARADLHDGMWIKLEELGPGDVVQRLSAGFFLTESNHQIIIFKGMPGEFLLRAGEDWYTNEAGGVRFKVNLMRGGGLVTGANLRPASYREPEGGFLFYLPAALQGTVLHYEGAPPGAATPDGEGKILITKGSSGPSYSQHLKNPARPELGFVSGLTELTLRKFPPAHP